MTIMALFFGEGACCRFQMNSKRIDTDPAVSTLPLRGFISLLKKPIPSWHSLLKEMHLWGFCHAWGCNYSKFSSNMMLLSS
jgi:hypothetical protein